MVSKLGQITSKEMEIILVVVCDVQAKLQEGKVWIKDQANFIKGFAKVIDKLKKRKGWTPLSMSTEEGSGWKKAPHEILKINTEST
jgi:hypothetical protein